MEEGTHAGFAYTSPSEHFIKCDVCNKQCTIDYYENHLKSKTHLNNLNKPNNFWKYCDTSWNKLMKKQKTIAGSADKN